MPAPSPTGVAPFPLAPSMKVPAAAQPTLQSIRAHPPAGRAASQPAEAVLNQLSGLTVSQRVAPAAPNPGSALVPGGSTLSSSSESMRGGEGQGLCRLCEKMVPMGMMKDHLHVCATHIRAYHGEEVWNS